MTPVEFLKRFVPEGSKVYGVRSGKQGRHVRLFILNTTMVAGLIDEPRISEIGPSVAAILKTPIDDNGWITVRGANFDPVDDLVYRLGFLLWGKSNALTSVTL